MLSKTLGVMLKLNNYLPKIIYFFSRIALFLVHFNNLEVIRSQYLKVSKKLSK